MCLVSNRNTPLIADKDIVCYKVFRDYQNDAEMPLDSPYYPYPWKKGLNINEEEADISYSHNKKQFFVKAGFFHCYTKEEYADMERDSFNNQSVRLFDYVTVKVVIPKGSQYFMNILKTEICANQLIV